jgi:hypothetical protein
MKTSRTVAGRHYQLTCTEEIIYKNQQRLTTEVRHLQHVARGYLD